MDAARRKHLSESIKARWKECEELAAILGCSKQQVYEKLYERLKAANLVQAVLDSFPDAIATAKIWMEASAPRVYEPSETASSTDELRLALWFINKCGSLELAERAFKAAAVATRAMQKP